MTWAAHWRALTSCGCACASVSSARVAQRGLPGAGWQAAGSMHLCMLVLLLLLLLLMPIRFLLTSLPVRIFYPRAAGLHLSPGGCPLAAAVCSRQLSARFCQLSEKRDCSLASVPRALEVPPRASGPNVTRTCARRRSRMAKSGCR